jgi:hypothetical protein
LIAVIHVDPEGSVDNAGEGGIKLQGGGVKLGKMTVLGIQLAMYQKQEKNPKGSPVNRAIDTKVSSFIPGLNDDIVGDYMPVARSPG